jgi:Family of unknown function (DUF5754)
MPTFEEEFPKDDPIWQYSNPHTVNNRAKKLYHKSVYRSTRPTKKYMIWNPITKRWIHFGQMYYQDFTKTGDKDRRRLYLRRSGGILGDWKNDLFSPNNLSRNLLW